jgi:DNA-binding NtrC family response regulator
MEGQRIPRVAVVVEDDPDCLEVYTTCLANAGYNVVPATNGLEALLQIKRVRPGSVVLDLLMPRLGGLEALKRIKAFDRAISVVVVTGATDPDLPRQALALGAKTVLTKPIDPMALLAALESPASRPAPAPRETAASRAETASTPRILVVDDEAEICSLLEEFLGLSGYRTSSVGDAATALRRIIEDPPDLVLLDVDMPRLGGIEALTAIRGLAVDTKVVMISGKASVETAKVALAYGAFDYVGKPFDLSHLGEVVAAALLWKG